MTALKLLLKIRKNIFKAFSNSYAYFIYLLSLLFIPLFSDFAVNDDYIFLRQIQSFYLNGLKISSQIDPSFISMGVLGYLWSGIFGVSFVSLRFLTILATLIFLIGVHKILYLLKIKKNIVNIILLILIFNPVLYNSSISFMTENYYLMFFIWSLYFYLKDILIPNNKNMLNIFLASIFAVLAFLVRQYGFILPFSYLIFSLTNYKRYNPKLLIHKTLVVCFINIIGLLIYLLWPRYSDVNGVNNLVQNLADMTIILQNIQKLIHTVSFFVFSVSALILPLFILFFTKSIKENFFLKINTFIVGTIIGYFYYNFDVFSLGNVFYLEGLHIKSNFRHTFVLSDTIIFKLFFILFLSLLTSYVTVTLIKNAFKIYNSKNYFNKPIFLIFLVFLNSLLILLMATDFYDRYLLPSIISLVLILSLYLNNLNFTNKNPFIKTVLFVYLFFYITFNLSLNISYFNNTALSFNIATTIQQEKNLQNQVYLNDTFNKYIIAKNSNDYTGNTTDKFFVKDSICFVQNFVQEDKNYYYKLNDLVTKVIKNPRVYGSKKKELPRITKNKDNILHQYQVFSPLHKIVGSKLYVGGFCIQD